MYKEMKQSISQDIKNYIYYHFPRACKMNASEYDHLLNKHYIDSMGLLEIITYLEITFCIEVRNGDLT
ncbi:MAG: hypothetical protein ACYC9O_00845, partial [Candidatus Latescibacterota bacterium]